MSAPNDLADPLAGLSVDVRGTTSPLIVAIDEAVEAQRDLEQELRSDFGTNNTDFRAMLLVFRLDRRGRSARATDVSHGLGISSGTATQVVGRLVSAGLLERAPDPSDARAGMLSLSADADRRLAAATSSVRDDLDGVVNSLDETEQAHLIELLEQVRDIFRQHQRTG